MKVGARIIGASGAIGGAIGGSMFEWFHHGSALAAIGLGLCGALGGFIGGYRAGRRMASQP